MKTERNILIAFLLNLFFSILEFVGGLFTRSVAIISDSIHDFGDALSIGISYVLEKISKRKPDNTYTFGYARYSILGAFITTMILTFGSVGVIYGAVLRIINPVEINSDGMIGFAIVGIIINFLAAYFTREGDSLNQKAVNLHMLEDVFGWVIVLVGGIIIKFTNIYIIDSIMSIFLAVFILYNALYNLKEILDLFLEKTPTNVNIEEVKKQVLKVTNVIDVHHIHVWSIDSVNNFATMHVVVRGGNTCEIKHKIKAKMKKYGIAHVTIEMENEDEKCDEKNCCMANTDACPHHHHHHHHHGHSHCHEECHGHCHEHNH